MQLPDFMMRFPALDLPIPEDIVTSRAVRSDRGLVVFFTFHKDFTLPPHSHKGQWGTVIHGQIKLTMNGDTRTYGPGDHYNIPSGVEHGAEITAGTVAMDVFEEPDRYPMRG